MANETVVFNWLHDSPSVRALVDSRIYPIAAPNEAAAPFIVYSVVYASAPRALASNPGLDQRIVQIDCYTRTHADLIALRDSARAALEIEYNIFRGEVLQDKEPDTNLLRTSLEFSLWLPR